MQELSKVSKYYKKVVLVFLNFVNDTTWSNKEIVKTKEVWKNHYSFILQKMGINFSQLEEHNVKLLYPDVNKVQR